MITNRVEAGVPTGGQFANRTRGEATITLETGREQPGEYVQIERHDWMDSSFFVDVNAGTGLTDDEFSDLNSNYLGSAIWSSTDDSDEEGRELDSRFSTSDFTPKAVARASADLHQFVSDNKEIVGRALATKGYAVDETGAIGRLGHDLWLTRNGHGAGFWDRPELDHQLGRDLTDAAQNLGELHITVLSDTEIEFV